jgi:hypothetical protein
VLDFAWSERRDLNPRPPVPQTGALTGLRYAPPGQGPMLYAGRRCRARAAGRSIVSCFKQRGLDPRAACDSAFAAGIWEPESCRLPPRRRPRAIVSLCSVGFLDVRTAAIAGGGQAHFRGEVAAPGGAVEGVLVTTCGTTVLSVDPILPGLAPSRTPTGFPSPRSRSASRSPPSAIILLNVALWSEATLRRYPQSGSRLP